MTSQCFYTRFTFRGKLSFGIILMNHLEKSPRVNHISYSLPPHQAKSPASLIIILFSILTLEFQT